MPILFPIIILLLVKLQPCLTQFIPAPTDLTAVQGYANITVRFKQVPPNICELNSTVKSYSGFADVDTDQHIFFWFFESRNDPLNDPLTMWVSGGPASSSMSELFQDFGPCRIDPNHQPVNNPYSWTSASNVIFVDQPTQVGFSYTEPMPAYVDKDRPDVSSIIGLPNNTCPDYAEGYCGTFSYSSTELTANSTAAAADNMWKTLQGFMGAFPKYSRNAFTMASSSYGGHFGPVFANYFETQNEKNLPGTQEIHLETLIVGNGWYDPLIQNVAYYNYTVDPGNTYDVQLLNPKQAAKMYNSLWGPGNCIDQTKACFKTGRDDVCSKADSFCGDYVEYVYVSASGRDETDVRELRPDPLIHDYYFGYLNRPHVQKALGVFTNYSDYPATTVHAFSVTGDDSRKALTIHDVRALLKRNITVIMYAGDADYECNWYGGEAVADEISAPGFNEAGYSNLSTPDGIVHAQVRQSDIFSFIRVFEAGHEVPTYQPEASLTFFSRAIHGLDIATGKIKVRPGGGYRSSGPLKSTYREGNATVQFHKLPPNAQYNITSNEPYIPHKKPPGRAARRRMRRESMSYRSIVAASSD